MQACPSLNVSSVLIIFDLYRTNSVIHMSNPEFWHFTLKSSGMLHYVDRF